MKVKYWILGSFVGLTVLLAAFFGTYLYLQSDTEASQSVPIQEKVEEPKITVQGLLEATNAEREKRGIKPLILDERLNASAQMKIDDIVKYNHHEHENFDGTRGFDYIFLKHRTCKIGTENLSQSLLVDRSTNQSTTKSWMDSESHRKAILNESYDQVGFAISEDGLHVVQHFCDID